MSSTDLPPTSQAPDLPSSESLPPVAPAPLDRYECKSCGYVYEPSRGDEARQIPPGTPFEDLPEAWRCPVCRVKKSQFNNVGPAGKASGFDENLRYGFGVNSLTPAAKNVLIFTALLAAAAFMLSLYTLN